MNCRIFSPCRYAIAFLVSLLSVQFAIGQSTTEDRIHEMQIRHVMDEGRLLQDNLRSAQARGDLEGVNEIQKLLKEAEATYRQLLAEKEGKQDKAPPVDAKGSFFALLKGKVWKIRESQTGSSQEMIFQDGSWAQRTGESGDISPYRTEFIWKGLFRVKNESAGEEYFYVLDDTLKELRIYSATAIYEGQLVKPER